MHEANLQVIVKNVLISICLNKLLHICISMFFLDYHVQLNLFILCMRSMGATYKAWASTKPHIILGAKQETKESNL